MFRKIFFVSFFAYLMINIFFLSAFYLNERRDFLHFIDHMEVIYKDIFIKIDEPHFKEWLKCTPHSKIQHYALLDEKFQVINENTTYPLEYLTYVLKKIKKNDEAFSFKRWDKAYPSLHNPKEGYFVSFLMSHPNKTHYLLIDVNVTEEYASANNDLILYFLTFFGLFSIIYCILLFAAYQTSKHMRSYMLIIEQQRTEAQQLATIKTEFLATMSHEIRTPINGFLGVIELLKDTDLTAHQKELVHIAQFSGKQLLSILNDILDFSKIESGRLKLEKRPIVLIDELDPFVKMNAKIAKNKGIDFIFKPKITADLVVLVDSVRLIQILQNIISNAIKFTHQGEIIFTVQLERIGRKKSQPVRVIFSIKDSGIGIDEKMIKHLFDKFSQADASTTRLYGGTGLGLSITKQLVQLMNGQIHVESTPGKGSTFTITLPLERQSIEDAQPSMVEQREENIEKTSLSILVVDDHTVNQIVLKGMIEKLGHKVITVESGQEALALIRERSFDLIFMDIQMPHMDGYQTLTRIRELEQKKGILTIPIIACSASQVDPGYIREDLFFTTISKPIDREQLKTVLYKNTPSL